MESYDGRGNCCAGVEVTVAGTVVGAIIGDCVGEELPSGVTAFRSPAPMGNPGEHETNKNATTKITVIFMFTRTPTYFEFSSNISICC